MADNYKTTGSTQTVKVEPSGEAIDAQIVRFTTKPHGVHAQVTVPLKAWEQGKANAYIEPVAKSIEELLHEGLASSATLAQDVDAQTGLLADFIEFTVILPAHGGMGTFSTQVPISVTELAGGAAGAPTNALKKAKQQLEHTANL